MNPSGPRGLTAVALVLVVASSFFLMTAGAGDSVNLGLQHASRTHYGRRTNYAAYGAMQLALDKLNTDPTYACDEADVVVPGDEELIYSLYILNNINGSDVLVAPDGRKVPRRMCYIKAKSDFRDYPGQYTTSLYSKGYLGNYFENHAVVATSNITIKNSVVDAYLISGATTPTPKLIRSKLGRISTNSIRPGGIIIDGNPNGVDPNIDCGVRWGPHGDVATVLTLSNGAKIHPDRTQEALKWPAKVPRFRPPRDPRGVADPVVTPPEVVTGERALPPGDYNGLVVKPGAKVRLSPGKYYFANDIVVTDGSLVVDNTGDGGTPCDVYVGKSFLASNSKVNWDNRPGDILPSVVKPPAFPGQSTRGPRMLRVYFVGSGAPKDTQRFAAENNSQLSLHASGKAMEVELRSGTEMWGGFKGFRFYAENAKLHYHKVDLPDPPPLASPTVTQTNGGSIAGALLMLFPRSGLSLLTQTTPPPAPTYPLQQVPDAAWCLQGLADEDTEGSEGGEIEEYYGS